MNDSDERMNRLREDITRQLEEIKLICRLAGLEKMSLATAIVRDPGNPNMYLFISDDPRCSHTFWWKPEERLPDTPGWVLIDIRPAPHGDRQEPDYLSLGFYDHREQRWRTQLGPLHGGYTVLFWACIPHIEESK